MQEKIAVIGLGYVGLPLLISLARHCTSVIGFDIDQNRIKALQSGNDWTGETDNAHLKKISALFTCQPLELHDCSFFIVTVPTPIDQAKRPDLRPLMRACQTLGEILRDRKKDPRAPLPLIVFESTVYPGLTEELCGAQIAALSGLSVHQDFKLGYSPERINPGDKANRLETITKIISAEDEESLTRVENVYTKIVGNNLHRAPSIRVAEMAKVIENTQRDLNVALMNELAVICDKVGIRTHDVLAAANTKWNFLKFAPGLVGGHCISVDPYYLTWRAQELGYHPDVILAGRRINDHMGIFVAQKIIKLIVGDGILRPGARVGMLGLAYKENVRDIRNSRVPDIVRELESFGVKVIVYDPLIDPNHARREYDIALGSREDLQDLDALVLAVPHQTLLDNAPALWAGLRPQGWIIDIKSVLRIESLPPKARYWSL